MRPRRDADHPRPSSADFMNEWSYGSTPPTSFHGKEKDNLTFLPVITCSSLALRYPRVTDLVGEHIVTAGFMVDLLFVTFISQINDNAACYLVWVCQSQWLRGLRRSYAASCWLELRARIPP
jgi:hypothetical protein